MSRKRTTKWNLFFQYISIAIMVVSGIVLVPFYLKYIPLDLYGAWLATGSILIWITGIDPGLSVILQQRTASHFAVGDKKNLGLIIGSGIFISFLFSVIILLVGLISTKYLFSFLNLSANFKFANNLLAAYTIAVIGGVLSLFSYSFTSINQGYQMSLSIGTVYTTIHIVSIVLTFVLLFSDYGLMAIAYSSLFRGIGMLGGNAFLTIRQIYIDKIKVDIQLESAYSLLKLMLYTFFSRLTGTIAQNAESFLIGRYLGVQQVPLFNFTKKSIDLSKMITERPAPAFMPAISHLYGSGDLERTKEILLRLFNIIIWLLGITVGGLMIFNQSFIRLWVGETFYGGLFLNSLLVFSMAVSVIFSYINSLIVAVGEIKSTNLIIFIQNLIMILLMLILIKNLGMIGLPLAISFPTVFFALPCIIRIFSKKLKLTAFEKISIVKEFLFSVIIAAVLIILFLYVFFSLIEIKDWLSFSIFVLFFLIFYVFLQFLISFKFKQETLVLLAKFHLLIKKIKSSQDFS